jgi:nicotinate-nucleotide pyrophosphorylase (carboxylating)
LADPGDPDAAALPDLETDAQELARRLLTEDGSDLTTDLTVPPGAFGAAAIRARTATVAAGLAYAGAVAREAGCDGVEWKVDEGEAVPASAVLGAMRGDLTAMLRAERPLLNLLQRACGIAAATRSFVDAVAGTRCRVLHTRKTAPGLRSFDIRAVLAGGGALHRVGLERVVMVKDNHWVALGRAGRSLEQVCREARERGAQAVQIEVESAAQVEAACRAGADRLLIDNQPPETFAELVKLARGLAPEIEIEATGGITVEAARAYADRGADFVSIGALTHSVAAADLTLEIE